MYYNRSRSPSVVSPSGVATSTDPGTNPTSALEELRAELRSLGAVVSPKSKRRTEFGSNVLNAHNAHRMTPMFRVASGRSDRSDMVEGGTEVSGGSFPHIPTSALLGEPSSLRPRTSESVASSKSAVSKTSIPRILPRMGVSTRSSKPSSAPQDFGNTMTTANQFTKGSATNVFSEAMVVERGQLLGELKALRARHGAHPLPPVNHIPPTATSSPVQYHTHNINRNTSLATNHSTSDGYEFPSLVRRDTNSTIIPSRSGSLALSRTVECGTPAHNNNNGVRRDFNNVSGGWSSRQGASMDVPQISTSTAGLGSVATTSIPSHGPNSPLSTVFNNHHNNTTHSGSKGRRSVGIHNSSSGNHQASPATAMYEATRSELNALLLEEGLPKYESTLINRHKGGDGDSSTPPMRRRNSSLPIKRRVSESATEMGTDFKSNSSTCTITPLQRTLSVVDELERTIAGSDQQDKKRSDSAEWWLGGAAEEQFTLGEGIGKDTRSIAAFNQRVDAKLTALEKAEKKRAAQAACLVNGNVPVEDKLLPGLRLLGDGATENEYRYEDMVAATENNANVIDHNRLMLLNGEGDDGDDDELTSQELGALHDNVHTQATLRHRKQLAKQTRYVDTIRAKMNRHTAADAAKEFTADVFMGALDTLSKYQQEPEKEIQSIRKIFYSDTHRRARLDRKVAAEKDITARGRTVLSLNRRGEYNEGCVTPEETSESEISEEEEEDTVAGTGSPEYKPTANLVADSDKVSAAVLAINDSDISFGFGSGTTKTTKTTPPTVSSLGDDVAKGAYVSKICRWWRIRTSKRRLRGQADAITQYNQLRVLQELVHTQVEGDCDGAGEKGDVATPASTASQLTPLSTLLHMDHDSSVNHPTPVRGEDAASISEGDGDDDEDALEMLLAEQDEQLRILTEQMEREELEDDAVLTIQKWARTKVLPRAQYARLNADISTSVDPITQHQQTASTSHDGDEAARANSPPKPAGDVDEPIVDNSPPDTTIYHPSSQLSPVGSPSLGSSHLQSQEVLAAATPALEVPIVGAEVPTTTDEDNVPTDPTIEESEPTISNNDNEDAPNNRKSAILNEHIEEQEVVESTPQDADPATEHTPAQAPSTPPPPTLLGVDTE